jgi:hypothetical protein
MDRIETFHFHADRNHPLQLYLRKLPLEKWHSSQVLQKRFYIYWMLTVKLFYLIP